MVHVGKTLFKIEAIQSILHGLPNLKISQVPPDSGFRGGGTMDPTQHVVSGSLFVTLTTTLTINLACICK